MKKKEKLPFGMIKIFSGLEIFGYYELFPYVVRIKNPMFLGFSHGYMEFNEYAVYSTEEVIEFNKNIILFGPVSVQPKFEVLYKLYLSYYSTPEASIEEYINHGIEAITNLIKKTKEGVSEDHPPSYSKEQLDSNNMTKDDVNEFFKSFKINKNNTN